MLKTRIHTNWTDKRQQKYKNNDNKHVRDEEKWQQMNNNYKNGEKSMTTLDTK